MPKKVKRSLAWLIAAPDKNNLANDLSSDELSHIAQEVMRNYDLDRANRSEWDAQSNRAMKLAKQVLEKKTTPWEGASSVKHPLITVATIQFAARAYPEICKSGSIVKCHITGDDKPEPVLPSIPPSSGTSVIPPEMMASAGSGAAMPQPQPQPQSLPGGLPSPTQTGAPGGIAPLPPVKQVGPKQLRANRISSHMNYQLTIEQEDWEADMDCLLHVLPVVGQCYKKTYFSAQDGHNVSELVLPDDCVVSKGRSRDIKKARRITHRLWVYSNEAIEKMRRGLWLNIDLGQASSDSNDTDAPHEFLEQHCYYDLDGDDYKEPYIVTVHKESGKVVRIAARFVADGIELDEKGKITRIEPDHYFTHYGFIPNPDGSINYLGFGQLLEPINASINTTLNQLLDSGHLANAGGGFVGRGVRMRGGVWRFKPGEWHMVDVQGGTLKENLIPAPFKEPSTVLFQLLGFLVGMGKEISVVQDILTGDARLAANMPVGTMMALVEQGLKVYVAIYKRIYRSLTEEFRKLYKLNARFLDPRVSFFISGHPEQYVDRSDYQANDVTVLPVAEPELASDMQRILKSQALKELSGRPGINEIELTRRLVRSIRPENVEDILLTDAQLSGKEPTPWAAPPAPQAVLAEAKAIRMKQQAEEANARLQMDIAKYQFELAWLESQIANSRADTLLKLAKAEEVDKEFYLNAYQQELNRIDQEVQRRLQLVKIAIDRAAQTANQPVDPAQQLGLEGPAVEEGPGPEPGPGPAEAGIPMMPEQQMAAPVEAGIS